MIGWIRTLLGGGRPRDDANEARIRMAGHVVLAFDMDRPVSIAGLGPVAGGPGGPKVARRADDGSGSTEH
jgi:hypothetical protein